MAGQPGQLEEPWRDGSGLIARVPGCLVFLRGNFRSRAANVPRVQETDPTLPYFSAV